MRWTNYAAAFALLGAIAPLADAGSYAGCSPSSWPVLSEAGVGGLHYYLVQYQQGTNTYWQLWKETNGIDGLQTTSSQACGAAADTFVQGACTVRCALPL